jgi:hypothetical protein
MVSSYGYDLVAWPLPGGARGFGADPRPTTTARRQPLLCEQAGEGHELSWAGGHRQARRGAGGRAGRTAEGGANEGLARRLHLTIGRAILGPASALMVTLIGRLPYPSTSQRERRPREARNRVLENSRHCRVEHIGPRYWQFSQTTTQFIFDARLLAAPVRSLVKVAG